MFLDGDCFMEDTKLTVNIDGGQSVVINVYEIIEREDISKKYIVYDIDGSENEEMYISVLEETDTTFTLKTISDENELREIEEYLLKVTDENGDV